MKLSEAILMNGMTKPQGFGAASFSSASAPCALGGALQSVNRQCARNDINYPITENICNFQTIKDLWLWTEREITCPVLECSDWTCNVPVSQIIWHLNDQHLWTRAQIAEWVASIEPKELEIVPEITIEELVISRRQYAEK